MSPGAYVNDSVVGEVRTDRIQLSDTEMPLLQIKYSHEALAGELPTVQIRRITLQVDADGGGASQFRMTLTTEREDETGTALADLTNVFDGAAGGSGSPTVTADLEALVEALNAVNGISARVLNERQNYSLASDDFIDIAETDIQENWMNVLYKDASEINQAAVRIGNPEAVDSGRLKLIRINGTCTGVTNGTLTIFRDDPDDDGADATEIDSFTLVAAETDYVRVNPLEANVYRGPLVIVVASDDLSACNIKVATQQAEY